MRNLQLTLLFLLIPTISYSATNYCTNGQLGAGWLFNELSGSAIDCTGHANTGTVGSSVTQGVTGKYSFAYNFLNVSATGLVWATPSGTINSLITPSMGAWIHPTSAGGAGNLCSGATIIAKSDGAHGPELCINSTGAIVFEAWWSGGGVVWTTSTSPVTFTGTWQHVAVTYSYSSTANIPIIYYNGVSQALTGATPVGSQVSDVSNELTIGNETAIAGVGQIGHFDGPIDEPFWANVTLSSADIASIMNNGIDGTEAPAVNPSTTIGRATIGGAVIN